MCHIKSFVLSCSPSSISTMNKEWSHHSHEMKISFICSRKVLKFVYLRTNSNLTVLNMGYKLELLQLKQQVFWQMTYSRSETNNAWKIPLEVRKFAFLHRTYFLSVLIIGLNITCTKFWILGICPRPTSYLQTPEFQNYVQVMFRPIITSDKKYVERQYTIFITLCENFPCFLRHRHALWHDFCQLD